MMKAIIITLLKKQDGFSNTIDNWIIANNSDVIMLSIIYSISRFESFKKADVAKIRDDFPIFLP